MIVCILCVDRENTSRLTIRLRMKVESLRVEIEKGWWQPLLKILQDSFSISPKAVLPTKEKEALKKAFGGFNAGFEQVSLCDPADDLFVAALHDICMRI